MKHNMTFLKRCLALVLALVMIISSSNLGFALKAFAVDESENKITVGELMVNTYELTEAEQALLESGLLAGDREITYTVPSDEDGLVTINAEEKTISISSFENWTPVQVRIIADNEVVEVIEKFGDLNAVAYSYNGDAFTVEVVLDLTETVAAGEQENMLNAAADLKAGLKNLAVIKGTEASLETVEAAIPAMGTVVDTAKTYHIEVSDSFVKAVETLEAQVNDYGMLLLRVMNDGYEAKVQYLMGNGADIEDALRETYNALDAIRNDELYGNTIISNALKAQDAAAYTQWVAFQGVLADLMDTLAPVYNDAWVAVNNSPLKADLTEAQYAQVDTLVAAIEETSEVEVKENLFVDTVTLRQSRALVAVTVDVVLMNVENAVDSDKLVKVAGISKVLYFPENAHDYDVQNTVYEQGILEQAVASFGDLYVQGCFETDDWELQLPEFLTEDMTLTITYTPNMYEVEGAMVAGSYPYGYQLTLPSHEDAQKAYDYTINGELYRQGMVYTVTGPTMVDVEEVKAYTIGSLYAIIGECFGNKGAQAVLNSGALLGDVAIYYREPNVQEGDMHLENNELMVGDAYSSGYGQAMWAPYSYGLDGVVEYFAPGAATATWNGRSVNVTYKLPLADQTAKAAQVAAAVNEIYAQYVDQKAGMDSLLGKKGDVEQLTGMYLSALKGIIRDFKFVDNVKKNQELRNYFINVITAIQNDCVTDGTGMLDILAMIKGYEANGMAYYYNNSKTVANEVAKLSSYLTDLVADEEKQVALAKLLQDPGVNRPELVEKISGLGESMTNIKAQLHPTHEMIDTSSENLAAMISALAGEAGVNVVANGAPFVISEEIAVQDESAVVLKAEIVIDGKKHTVQTGEVDKYSVLTSAMIAELQAKVDAYLAEALGENAKYYNVVNNVTTDLNWNLGEELTNNLTVTVTADAKEYTVKIDGEADQVISIHKLNIKLPAYPNEGGVEKYSYIYTVAGETLDKLVREYTFTLEQIDTLFVDGSYTITRTVRNIQQDIIDNITGGNKPEDKPDEDQPGEGGGETETPAAPAATMDFLFDENGDVCHVNINMDATGAGVQEFMFLIMDNFGYVALNGEQFLGESDAGDGLELSIQTMVNALLNDETFSQQTIIDLGKNNGGKVLNTTITLATGKDSAPLFSPEPIPCTISLNSVPSQVVTVANALDAAKNNLKFYSDNGILVTELTLPEKIYEVYLTALLAAGEIDTDDMNAVNNEIAFNFLYDYVELVLGNDAITTQTFQNTLNKLDAIANKVGQDLPNKDLTAYEGAFQALRTMFKSVTITRNGDAPLDIKAVATSDNLNKVVDAAGVREGAYALYIGMLKELREGNTLEVNATATLINTTKDFEALVVDLDEGIEGGKDVIDAVKGGQDAIVDEAKDNVKGNGLANSVDYTSDLIGRVSEVTGPAAIYLLDDVTGNLVINHTTILDLNGKTINGNITVKGGQLFIVDSKIATTDCGTVTGTVSGNVHIIAGNYNADVTAYLPDGYKQVGMTVQNAVYTVERQGNEFVVVLNSDFMSDACVNGYLPSMRYMAAQIAIDAALNFYIPANLDIQGNRIYGIDDDFIDVFALTGMSVGELFDLNLANVRIDGMSDLVNTIIRDMMQFGDIADAIENETVLASYTFQTNPWAVEFMHVADGDYMTVGIVADDEINRDVTMSLKVTGDNVKKLIPYLRELDAIVVYDESTCTIDLEQPYRDGKHIVLEGGATAHLSLDLTVHGEDQFDHDDYKNILAVIFAYGNPEKADALISAIGSDEKLNAAFNDMTVREVIKALGAMSRTVSFTEMASAVGAADLVSDSADDLEHLYHLVACAAGKVLAKLESMNINGKIDAAQDLADKAADKLELSTLKTIVDKAGNVIDRVQAKVDLDSKLGALDQGDGTYLLYYAYERSGSVDYRGFGADITLNKTSGMLKVKIFDEEDCLWGDANHDGLVNAMDATLVLQYSVDTVAEDQFFCTKRTDVNGDGEINAMDATLILQHSVGTITKFPVEE